MFLEVRQCMLSVVVQFVVNDTFFFFVSLSSHQNSRSRCKISMICTFLVFFIFNFYFLLFYKIMIYFQSQSLILIYDMLFFFNLI